VRDTSLEISTATDSQDIVSAAAQGDTEDARIAEQPMESEQLDGSTVLSFEHPRSERTMLIERLVAAHEQKFSERGKPQASESLTASESLMKLSKGKKCLIEIRKRPGKPTMPSNNQYTSAKHPRADSRSRKDKSRSAARIRGTVRRLSTEEERQELAKVNIPLAPVVMDALLTLPGGPEATLYLARNPKEARKLQQLPGPMALAHVAQLTARLAPNFRDDKRPGPPAPIRPLMGSSTKSSIPPEEMSFREYHRWRDAEEKQRYRR